MVFPADDEPTKPVRPSEEPFFFCGVNPLKEYAISELERCAEDASNEGR